ncbi:unnamed protein product [Clonostachys solani]|uniref:Uncharacterized protein n=1 Tax=Clonostachys solani TaxID=160281 RepID=A0A9N9Z4B8_9HYPO|nr:unnamed protein product [Clonostachys solani]
MRAFSSSFCIVSFILASYSEGFSRIQTWPYNPTATANLLGEQPKMGHENMPGTNSHTLPDLNTAAWILPQNVNDGSSMNTNSMAYPPQGQALTGFGPEAPFHNLNTSFPSANISSPVYDPYAQGEPNPIGFSGNHGSSMRPGLQPLRPQAAPAFPNSQVLDQNLFSQSSLQAQGPPLMQAYHYTNQPALQPVSPYPNGAGQNVPSRMTYPGTYQNPLLGPTGQALPAGYPQIPLETQKAHRREKRQREKSDSEEPAQKKHKKTKRPRVKEPPPEYNRRYPRPPSWGVASDGSPLFVYNDDGELRTDRKYTSEEIRTYIENCPRKLRIWVQQSPTQVADRLGNRNTCMWMGCIKQGHKIDTGFFRIAFDEFYKQSKRGHRDPLRPAAVMHMWCYEQCFDPLVDYHHYRLKADKRPLTKETRNMISIINKGKHIVREAFKPWLNNTEFTEHPRQYTGSLSSALNEYHLSNRSKNRKLAQEASKNPGECTINTHKGDLMVFCLRAEKGKQDMRQKNQPVNRFQFRPRPRKLRMISVDEDSDSDSESEILEIYAGPGGAAIQPEEPSHALKPLGEKALNSRTPAADVGSRQKGSHPGADGAENEEPKGSVRNGLEDDKRRGITHEEAPLYELKLPGLENPTEPELGPTEPGLSLDAYFFTEQELGFTENGSPSDVLFGEEPAIADAEKFDFFFNELQNDLDSSSFVEQPVPKESQSPGELQKPKELPELKLPESKELRNPELPELDELPELELPEPKEPPKPKELEKQPKEVSGVEDLSGSGGSQVAEAGPGGASC